MSCKWIDKKYGFLNLLSVIKGSKKKIEDISIGIRQRFDRQLNDSLFYLHYFFEIERHCFTIFIKKIIYLCKVRKKNCKDNFTQIDKTEIYIKIYFDFIGKNAWERTSNTTVVKED